MNPRIVYTKALIVLLLFATQTNASTNTGKLTIPDYSYEKHPMYYLPQFANNKPSPVVMKKYTHYAASGRKTTARSVFAPYQANYNKFGSDQLFMTGLDALHITRPREHDHMQNYINVELNADARVFVLLGAPWLNETSVHTITPTSVQGLDAKWQGVVPISSVNRRRIFVGREKFSRALPSNAVALQCNVKKGQVLTLPHLNKITINGLNVLDYALVFAQPDSDLTSTPRPFPYPASPTSVEQIDTGNVINTAMEPAIPNTKCPDWLHDLYRTPSRDSTIGSEQGELMHWRTWHAPIDPIYWCYFDHEHGSYPGEYKPVLDYTAYKTYDANTDHKRQEESDEGFKVYAIVLQEQRKYLIITVHIQASKPRRFFTRHHTGIFAVLNDKWELEMELHMKMDFGTAMATLASGKNVPMNAAEAAVEREIQQRPYNVFRRFNVINVDESVPFPQSLDMSLRYRMGRRPTAKNRKLIMQGMYENWVGLPNTCAFCKKRKRCGFVIDIRNVATAKRTMNGNDSEEMQWLRGDSLSRVLKIRQDVTLGREHCAFNIFESTGLPKLDESHGLFYTDAYFSEVHASAGKNSVRQLISAGMKSIVVRKGVLTMADPWSGAFEYARTRDEKRRRIENTENAVVREVN